MRAAYLDHLRVGRVDHFGRQDRQHGNFGADPLGQGDAVLDSFPGEFRPVRGYQDMGVDRLSLIYRSVLGRISQKQKCTSQFDFGPLISKIGSGP
jgi:hypothetical protein